jgi:hypothetical protein
VEPTPATATTKATAAALVHDGLGNVVIHALPARRTALSAHEPALAIALLMVHVTPSTTTTASAATTALTLTRSLLRLLELLLLVGIVPSPVRTATTTTTATMARTTGTHPALIHPRPTTSRTTRTTTPTLLLLLLLRGLIHHLLHHSRVHTRRHPARPTTRPTPAHHLLHLLHLLHIHHLRHGRVHIPVHHHLLLEHGHGLLHALDILRHDLARHARRARPHAAAHAHSRHLPAIIHPTPTPTPTSTAHTLPLTPKLAPAAGGILVIAEVAPRLGFLDLDRLAVDLEVGGEAGLDAGLALEGHEAESTRAARVLVHHERGVDDAAELRKVLAELVVGGFLADAADEDLGRLLLLVAGDGALGVDLDRGLALEWFGEGRGHSRSCRPGSAPSP